MVDGEMLEVVDENDVVIGIDTRENIHKNGLLHREVWVQFYTPGGDLIFQHRAKDKDTYPDLLDPTAAGHVEIGADYLSTAVKEVEEETGLHVRPDDLVFIFKMRASSDDPVTNKTNNVIRAVYAYAFNGSLADLNVEEGKSQGFQSWPLEKMKNLTEAEKALFIPTVVSAKALPMYERIATLVNKDS